MGGRLRACLPSRRAAEVPQREIVFVLDRSASMTNKVEASFLKDDKVLDVAWTKAAAILAAY